jgi:hypothetical protein
VKRLTREQLQARKDQAVRFVRDILDDPDRADEIEDEDLEDYAQRRKFSLINQRRNRVMPNNDPRSKAELLDAIDDLTQDNEDLQSQLDAIQDILSPEDEEDDDNGNDDDDDYGPR